MSAAHDHNRGYVREDFDSWGVPAAIDREPIRGGRRVSAARMFNTGTIVSQSSVLRASAAIERWETVKPALIGIVAGLTFAATAAWVML